MGTLNAFGDLLNNWLDHYLPDVLGRSQNTVKSYKSAWASLISFLYREKGVAADKITFDILTFELLMEFLDWVKKVRKTTDATRNSRRAAIVKFAEYAQNYDFDAAFKFYAAAKKLPGKKQTDSRERMAMSKEQTKAMLNIVDICDRYGRRDFTILNLLYATGCRAQELCDLKVKDVEIQSDGKASIRLHGKGKKCRRVRISRSYADTLVKHMKSARIVNQPGRYVFASQRNPQMSVVAVEKLVAKYFLRAKKEYPALFADITVTPHTFRHTTATHMVEAGVPLMVISRFLGHANINTTLVYAKLSETDVNEKLKRWNSEYWGEYMGDPIDEDELDTMTDEQRNLSKIFGRK